MKSTFLVAAAAFALGTAAVAQDTTSQPTTSPDAGMNAGSAQPAMPSSPADQAPMSTPPGGTGGSMTPPSGTSDTMTPSATPDASSPSTSSGMAPSGNGMSQGTPGTGMSGSAMSGGTGMAASTDTSNYPKCSKTVTDKCVQAQGGGMHHPMKKHRK